MTAKGSGEAGENPLVPNAKLRQMYTLMLEARTLEEALAKRAAAKGKKRIVNIRGQEAVRVSTAIELGAEDLVSDVAATAGMGLILGGDAASLLREMARPRTDGSKALRKLGVSRMLQAVETPEERLRLALGAALALKAQGRQGVMLAYANKGEINSATWRRVLGMAAKLELPIIFVVLPQRGARKADADLAEVCDDARAAGVPGIPVDACDAVALYRVAQESLGRTRSGDGPVLIESVGWPAKMGGGADDPLEHLQESLLARRICKPAWFQQAAKQARRQLVKKRGASGKA